MPLLETIGSGGAKAFGLNSGGKKAFILKSVYNTATLYAPLNDTSIYLSGAKSGSYFVTVDSDSTFDVDPLINRDVLKSPNSGATISADGKVINKISVAGISLSSTHSVSIWQRSRTGAAVGMLLSKYWDNEGVSGSPLDIWDGNADGNIYGNIGDSMTNPFSDSGTTQDWKSQTWTHWCFTFDGGTARMYKNGAFIGTMSTYRSFTTHAGNGSWTLGSWAGPYAGDYWLTDSNFADFSWWNGSALNLTSVQNIYNAGPGF